MYLFLVFLQGVLLFASGIFFSLCINMLDGSKADIQACIAVCSVSAANETLEIFLFIGKRYPAFL